MDALNNAAQYGFKDESVIKVLSKDYFGSENLKPVDDKFDIRADRILAQARAFKIHDRIDFKSADNILSEGAAILKGIKLIHDPICAATNTAHKLATSTRKKLIDPVKEGCRIIEIAMGNFKLIEDKRIADEQRKKEEIAQKEQKDAALNQAKELKEEGAQKEVINSVLEMAKTPVQVTQPPEGELMSRTSFIPSWDIKVTDKKSVPEIYKTVNEASIRAAVKAAKGDIEIPGVHIFEIFQTRKKAF